MRSGATGLSALSAAHDRTGVAGPRASGYRTPHPASEVPGRQDHGQLRLPGHPTLNKTLVLELARCEFLARRENVLLLGNSGTGKTHIALALGLAACQRGHRVRFTTTAALVSELIEAREEKKLLRFQKQIASYELLIVDDWASCRSRRLAPNCSSRCSANATKRGSTLITSNLPFQEWTEVLGSERLTGALLDRLTHHVHILEMNGDSYRLKQSRRKRTSSAER